ncbi:MAG TPA: porin [Verrucomicrobiae bacterium]|jgi:phosphate-selective porin OprO/OprP|nr:porin [Verrucomicrobiae bacterium]
MKTKEWLVMTLIGTQLAAESISQAQTETNKQSDIEDLKQQIQVLQEKVDALEHRQQEAQPASRVAPKPSASLTVGSDGVNFRSANSNFVAGLHAWVQVDSRTFFQDEHTPGIDGFLLRRARLIFTGTLYHDFDYNLTPEFAGTSPQILDAYLNYHYRPELQLQFGKFKPPVGLEALQPDIYTSFNERSLVSDLAPYRGIGAELHGDVFGGVLSYAGGVFNGLPDLNTTTINANYENDLAFAGRIFVSPFKQTTITPLKGLGVGVSGTYEYDHTNAAAAGLTPGYITDGQQKFFTYPASTLPDGAHWRISPQGYYYWGPFGLIGEYIISDQQIESTTAPVTRGRLRNSAWEVSGGWVLTGEKDSYAGVTPSHPFSIENGGWGAWQIVGRYARLNVDDAAFPKFASATGSASRAEAWAVGLNWYLNANLRANLSFSRTTFDGGSANSATKQAEDVLFTRVQLAF